MKSIQLKTSELIAVRDEANQLLSGEKLSFLAKYRLSSVYSQLLEKTKAFDETRKEMIQSLGVLDEKKENYEIPEDKREEFTREIQALLDSEVEFAFEPLPISLLAQLESSRVYYNIFKIFED
jgi:hypothetical protein